MVNVLNVRYWDGIWIPLHKLVKNSVMINLKLEMNNVMMLLIILIVKIVNIFVNPIANNAILIMVHVQFAEKDYLLKTIIVIMYVEIV